MPASTVAEEKAEVVVIKQCNVCRVYFLGAFDGDYRCPECRKNGKEPVRYASLDSGEDSETNDEQTAA